MEDKVKIREAKEEEVESFVGWALEEGWNMPLKDLPSYFHSYPKGWLIAEMQGTVVGKLYSTKYPQGMGHIGYIIVRKEHRGRGVGTQLIQHALHNYLSGCTTIGLYSSHQQLPFYAKLGFRVQVRVLRMSCSQLQLPVDPFFSSKNRILEPISPETTDLVTKYDERLSGSYRPEFWKLYSSLLPPSHCLLCRSASKEEILGVGAIRPLANSTKIGPIYAENGDIAKDILFRLLQGLDGEVVLDIFENNVQAMHLVESVGFTKRNEALRLMRSNDTKFSCPCPPNEDKIFCITSLDFN